MSIGCTNGVITIDNVYKYLLYARQMYFDIDSFYPPINPEVYTITTNDKWNESPSKDARVLISRTRAYGISYGKGEISHR